MTLFENIRNWLDNLFALEIKMDEGAGETGEKPNEKSCCCGGECSCETCTCEKDIVTLRDAFTAYIHLCRKEQRYAEPTIDSYEVIRDRHLQYIIDENVFDLDEHKVQVALDNEIAKGLSVSTVKKYKSVLLRIFEAYRPDFKPEVKVKK